MPADTDELPDTLCLPLWPEWEGYHVLSLTQPIPDYFYTTNGLSWPRSSEAFEFWQSLICNIFEGNSITPSFSCQKIFSFLFLGNRTIDVVRQPDGCLLWWDCWYLILRIRMTTNATRTRVKTTPTRMPRKGVNSRGTGLSGKTWGGCENWLPWNFALALPIFPFTNNLQNDKNIKQPIFQYPWHCFEGHFCIHIASAVRSTYCCLDPF